MSYKKLVVKKVRYEKKSKKNKTHLLLRLLEKSQN